MVDISVIVPFFNTEKYISRCLRSLQLQKKANVEFILINDGSTDDSLSVCSDYLKIDDRFILISTNHKGVSAARNVGLDRASGKYVLFLDSDDCLLKNALKQLYFVAEKYDCDVVKYNAKLIHGEKWMKDSFKRHNEMIEDFTPEDIFRYKDCRPFVWSHFIKMDILKGIYFNESLVLGEDQEYIIRYLLRAKRVLFTRKKYYCHYNNPDSNYNVVVSDSEIMCDNHIRMVESVIKEVDLKSTYYTEWIFDVLYNSFINSDKTRRNRDRIIQIFKDKSMADELVDYERKNKLGLFNES